MRGVKFLVIYHSGARNSCHAIICIIAWQEIRDPEWSVTRYFTPLIGGEPLAEVVKINIFAYYEGMH